MLNWLKRPHVRTYQPTVRSTRGSLLIGWAVYRWRQASVPTNQVTLFECSCDVISTPLVIDMLLFKIILVGHDERFIY